MCVRLGKDYLGGQVMKKILVGLSFLLLCFTLIILNACTTKDDGKFVSDKNIISNNKEFHNYLKIIENSFCFYEDDILNFVISDKVVKFPL